MWEHHLQYVESAKDLARERQRKPPVRAALEPFTDERVWNAIRARRGEIPANVAKPVKQAEIETLLASQDEVGEDVADGYFYARALARERWAEPWMDGVERVVLVHRLREIVAQVGFTRFEAVAPDVDGELEMGVKRAAISREAKWLPAIENRGEGVFLGFSRPAIDAWLALPAVKQRGERLVQGFARWQVDHPGSGRLFPGLPFVFLHSLSHLLLTAVALECGYPASSIRERVYAGAAGHGILLYTGSPDAEGTLGGLVETGRKVAAHLRLALDRGELCSNDPVCAYHAPDDPNETRWLHGAACHGCLLIAETSCEQHNDFLDRALVVPTVENLEAGFFRRRGA